MRSVGPLQVRSKAQRNTLCFYCPRFVGRTKLKLTHVLPPTSTSRFSHLCLPRRSIWEGGSLASPRLRSLVARVDSPLPSALTSIIRTAPMLAPAALPSIRAVPNRDVFYAAFPKLHSTCRFVPLLGKLRHAQLAIIEADCFALK